jgi:hypothetical protein
MNSTSAATRAARLFAWLLGAVATGILWCAVSVFALGAYDRAFSRLAFFQLLAALAAVTAIAGLVGYAVTVTARGSRQTPSVAVISGGLFAVFMQCVMLAADRSITNGAPWLLVVSIAVLLGAATSQVGQRNEA